MSESKAPQASRPYIADAGYGIPKSIKGTLPWEHVAQTLAPVKNYWLSTVSPNGHPHAMPVWGVWVENRLYFGGSPQTRKARNLAANPQLVIHTENGESVVIIEGTAEDISDPALLTRIDDAYEVKYGMRHGTPIWGVRPSKIFAWTSFPADTTRWIFEK